MSGQVVLPDAVPTRHGLQRRGHGMVWWLLRAMVLSMKVSRWCCPMRCTRAMACSVGS